MRICAVADCDRPHYGRGWCSTHWYRVSKYGQTELPEKPAAEPTRCRDCGQPCAGGLRCMPCHLRNVSSGPLVCTCPVPLPEPILLFGPTTMQCRTCLRKVVT